MVTAKPGSGGHSAEDGRKASPKVALGLGALLQHVWNHAFAWCGRCIMGRMQQGDFIGVFDSGLGGISVLKRLTDLLPHERFVFYGDSAHAPYGDKDPEWVLRRSRLITEALMGQGAKAIVIACNTATSVAAAALRAEHPDFPIVGIEPALKPATEFAHHERILVMATDITIRLDKFHRLARQYGSHSDLITVPCKGLADLIETGKLDGREMRDLLEGYLAPYRGQVSSVVLGCTHYPFVANQIRAVLGPVPLFDGGPGTARQTKRLLAQRDLLAPATQKGEVVFRSSNTQPQQVQLYEQFYRLPLPEAL